MDEILPWHSAVQDLARRVRSGAPERAWRVQGLKGSAGAFFLTRLLATLARPALVIAPSAKEAEQFTSDLRFFCGEPDDLPPFGRRVHHLPSWEIMPFEDLSPTSDVVAARIEGLYHLRQCMHPVIVTTPEALLQRVPPRRAFSNRYAYLVESDDTDRDDLGRQLEQWGYRRVSLVEDRGEFTLRGDIIDVFPPAHPYPLRLQLAGDTIETIHDFDPVSQRLLEQRSELLILPVREFDPSAASSREVLQRIEARAFELDVGREERSTVLDGLSNGLLFPGVEFCLPYFHETLDTVWDYLPEQTVACVIDPSNVEAALERTWEQIERRGTERASEHRFFPPVELLYENPSGWRRSATRLPTIEIDPLDVLGGSEHNRICLRSFSTADLKVKKVHQRHEVGFAPVAQHLAGWCRERLRVLFVASNDAQCQRLIRLLETHDVPATSAREPFEQVLETAASVGTVRVVQGRLSQGFRLPDEQLAVVTEADVFGEPRRRAGRRVSVAQLLKSLGELKQDDFVVHLDHGVGVYRGLRHLRVADTEGDYLHLEYAGGDKLYLPVDRIALVQKYVGSDGAAPPLDKLGGASWDKVKQRTRESVLSMAKELLAVYAAREVDERRPYSAPDEYYREFEARFPFEETPDQRQAIEDSLADLQERKPMDRLICGDVGYGKTEVALRAAFLAAMDGRQVAVLVPTTVLAQQHFTTFCKRFEGYPVKIAMLSRFLAPAETKAVLRGLQDGTVDIVVGTHRLLQADTGFHRLGLLVIDEEHRFGVRHKEKIKELRKTVDVMALTATPIPRTLQMSLMGIRDLSVIETPPVDRLAIRTYVTRFDEDIIRDAILRELSRGGQVFFVHNRVQNIEIMAEHVRRLVPEAKIAVAHGQMTERDLEKVMLAFMTREANVLVCSSIVESGLDIPNANTILINRADHLGLAQLYQLRGRVGRSHLRAYAYLMIPGEHVITREAQKRLRVLQELDDLGGGFRLAAHDLEIRGAGNLLGKQQSGQITAVGFELYTQMLEDAVQELRGQRRKVEVEPEIQLGFPAYIPDTYIADENQRLTFYRRLAAAKNREETDDLAAEMQERYGRIPPLVDSLLRVMDLRRDLKAWMVLRVGLRQGLVTFQFHPEAPIEVDRLITLAESGHGRFKLSSDFQLSFRPESADWDGLVSEVQSVLKDLRRLPASPSQDDPPRRDGTTSAYR